MLDWLGVTFVSKAASECDRFEALHCERQALPSLPRQSHRPTQRVMSARRCVDGIIQRLLELCVACGQ